MGMRGFKPHDHLTGVVYGSLLRNLSCWYNGPSSNIKRIRVHRDPFMTTKNNRVTSQSEVVSGDNAFSYKRVIVKAGTSLLTGATDELDLKMMAKIVGQIAKLHASQIEIMLVSSGAVSAGRHVLGLSRQGKDLPLRQVLAAVGQGRVIHSYEQLFSRHGIKVAQALLSRRDLVDRLGYLNIRNTLLALLDRDVVPIINENDVVAVEELAGNVFGDNDTLSAMVANIVDADLLVLLGDIEGLYTRDPHLDPGARLVPIVKRISDDVETMGGPSWKDNGRGGMATKLDAARLATSSGINVVIASGLELDVITRLVNGESIGTFFPATSSKMESRKRWMLSGLSVKGEVGIDDGAAVVLRLEHRSLLPAGVTQVNGYFERGDIISILDSNRIQIACGITNYGSRDLNEIKGVHSDRIIGTLGREYGDEVVHRNNMVIL